jgi:hypothetical protein
MRPRTVNISTYHLRLSCSAVVFIPVRVHVRFKRFFITITGHSANKHAHTHARTHTCTHTHAHTHILGALDHALIEDPLEFHQLFERKR